MWRFQTSSTRDDYMVMKENEPHKIYKMNEPDFHDDENSQKMFDSALQSARSRQQSLASNEEIKEENKERLQDANAALGDFKITLNSVEER